MRELRRLIQALSTLAALRVANAVAERLLEASDPDRGTPPDLAEAGMVTAVVIDFPETPDLVRTKEIVAALIAEEKRLHDRWPVHFVEKRKVHMDRIYAYLDEHILLSREED